MSTMSEAANELSLFAVNDGTLYDSRVMPICINLSKHLAAGNYKAEEAIKVWENLADEAAKSYAKQFDKEGNWNKIFKPEDRKQAAKYFAEYYEEHVCDEAQKIASAEYVLVKIYDFTRDVNGNPTARHIAVPCNAEGMIPANAIEIKPQRKQTGTSNYLDGVDTAMEKGKFKLSAYDRISLQGSRAEGAILVVFKRKPMTIPENEQVRT